MKPRIVYVDDIVNNLTAFEGLFEDEWDVKTYITPVNALLALPEVKPIVIVSDQRMPGMTGVQFLEQTIKICPHAMRVIVTGFSDELQVIDSIRIAKVHDYIRKPYSNGEIELRIRIVHENYKNFETERREKESLLTESRELNKKHDHLVAVIFDLKNQIEELKKKS